MPAVTIVMPAYNVEKYIATGLDSCLDQTYTDIEVIVVDDGSTDGTWHVISEYANKDNRIVPIHQDNQGVSEARNAALERAQGDYVLFLDSDDWLEANCVEVLLDHTVQGAEELLCVDCFFVDIEKNGKYSRTCQTKDYTDEICSRDTVIKHMGQTSKFRLVSSCYKLFNLQLIKKHNIRFYKGIHQGEDGLFTFQYLCNVNKAKYIRVPLWNILNRPGSACNSPYTSKWITAITAIDTMIEYYQEKDEEVLSVLFAFKAERAMWIIGSCLKEKGAFQNDYLYAKDIINQYGKHLVRRDNTAKIKLLCLFYTRVPYIVAKKIIRLKSLIFS